MAGPGTQDVAGGAAAGRRARVLHGAFLRRDRSDDLVPGEHGQDAAVPRARAFARAAAATRGVAPPRRRQDISMTQSRSEHPATPHVRTLEALPWLVNGSADHPDLVEARAHLARCSECQE